MNPSRSCAPPWSAGPPRLPQLHGPGRGQQHSDPEVWKPLQKICEELAAIPFHPPRGLARLQGRGPQRGDQEAPSRSTSSAWSTRLHRASRLAGRDRSPLRDKNVAFVQAPALPRLEDSSYLRGLFYSYRYFFDVSMPCRRTATPSSSADPGPDRAACSRRWVAGTQLHHRGRGVQPADPSPQSNQVGVYDPAWGRDDALSFDGLKKQRFRWALGGIQILRATGGSRPAVHHAPPHRRQRMHYCSARSSVRRSANQLLHPHPDRHRDRVATHHSLPLRQMAGTCWWCRCLPDDGILRALWPAPDDQLHLGDAVRALRCGLPSPGWCAGLRARSGQSGRRFLRTSKVKKGSGTIWRAFARARESFIALIACSRSAPCWCALRVSRHRSSGCCCSSRPSSTPARWASAAEKVR